MSKLHNKTNSAKALTRLFVFELLLLLLFTLPLLTFTFLALLLLYSVEDQSQLPKTELLESVLTIVFLIKLKTIDITTKSHCLTVREPLISNVLLKTP